MLRHGLPLHFTRHFYVCFVAVCFLFSQNVVAKGCSQSYVARPFYAAIGYVSSDNLMKFTSIDTIYLAAVDKYSRKHPGEQPGAAVRESLDTSHRDDGVDSSSEDSHPHRQVDHEDGDAVQVPSSPAQPKHAPHDTIWRRLKAFFAEIFQTR